MAVDLQAFRDGEDSIEAKAGAFWVAAAIKVFLDLHTRE